METHPEEPVRLDARAGRHELGHLDASGSHRKAAEPAQDVGFAEHLRTRKEQRWLRSATDDLGQHDRQWEGGSRSLWRRVGILQR